MKQFIISKLKIKIIFTLFLLVLFLQQARSPAHAQSFRFQAWGDTKDGTSVLSALSAQAKPFNPLFTIYSGDLCSSGFNISCITPWKAALDGNSNNRTSAKTFSVRGNHDSSDAAGWSNYFNYSSMASSIGVTNYRELVPDITYSFDYGNSHFVGLDDLGDATSMTSATIFWLDSDLTQAESRGLTHAFLFFHGPLYYVDGHSAGINQGIVNVINKHPIVTATFHGHEHVLSHVKLTSSRISTLTKPIDEFVVGSAGAGLYSCSSGRSDWCLSKNGFAIVDVNGGNVTVNFYQQGSASAIHSAAINKSGGSGPTNTPVPTAQNPSPTTINTPTSTGSTVTPGFCSQTFKDNLRAIYTVTTDAATYRIWVRLDNRNAASNSIGVQVDNNCPEIVGNSSVLSSEPWTWVDYKNGGTSSKFNFNFTAGIHTITLGNNYETGARVDKILITKDLYCVPTGDGSNCAANNPTVTPNVTGPENYCPRKPFGDAGSPGGAACDGVIDGIDYSIWLRSQCHPAANQQCNSLNADFNSDGNVDDADLSIWMKNRI